ncbi:MAG: hypothetical protein HZB38_05840 [Planctomycetes bacterium]|nr:hypothetical protein [Planctomycetota bacterium]
MNSEPYCSNCGYRLTGLVDSSKCPECGKPIVEVLQRTPRTLLGGKRYRSGTVVFGLPLVDIALGPSGNESRGHARGIIAIGDIATGWVALGGVARGLIAVGGVAVGGFTFGGFSAGLFGAIGGAAIGGLALGGGAAGGIAAGGVAAGAVAQGGLAVGWLARGGQTFTLHGWSPVARDQTAAAFFQRWHWLLGDLAMPGMAGLTLAAWIVFLAMTVGLCATALVFVALMRSRRNHVG